MGRERLGVGRRGVHRRLAGREVRLRQVKSDDRQLHGHVLGDLHHRRDIVQRTAHLRRERHRRRREEFHDRAVVAPTEKFDVFVEAPCVDEFADVRERGSFAGEHRPPVGPAPLQRRQGLDRGLDVVLRSHDPDVREQVLAPVPERRVRRAPSEHVELRRVPHDERVVRMHAAAPRGDPPIRLVRRDRDVGERERKALEGKCGAIAAPPAAEPRLEQLGNEVVVVEHEPRPAGSEQLEGREEQVGRIAHLDDVEWPPKAETRPEEADPERRLPELADVRERAAARGLEGKAADLDSVEHGVRLEITVDSLGTDHNDRPARVPECLRLHPDSPVGGDGEVLDGDQRAPAHRQGVFRRRASHAPASGARPIGRLWPAMSRGG